ncbi:DoxX family protein [Yeosuana aromativorans]|nr:DoxX family protein [Yeosuana aromativorans]
MKSYLNTETNSKYIHLVLLVVRVSVAMLMLTHGYPKLMKLLEGGEIQFADPIGLGQGLSFVLVIFAEFFCSILIGIGFATRLASIPLIINMSVAAFVVFASAPISKKEFPILYLLIYLILLVVGSGKYSVDYLISGKK